MKTDLGDADGPGAAHEAGDGASADQLLAFDAFVGSVDRWARSFRQWPPAARIEEEWSAVGPRLAAVRGELARVLVVGVLGGTGTGKSTLVNALAGSEVTAAGDVARPTTTRPVVVAGPQVDCGWLPIERWGAKLVRSDSAAVAEIVLVDCPDPDTQGAVDAGNDNANRNRDLLEQVLPECDVLLVVSTAQKYRSWAVAREIVEFAPGRPVLFVQTHASRDFDIRDDWRRELERQGFDVPGIHRVDGVEAIRRAAAGLPPDEGFSRLLESIRTELAGRAARRVRRTGAGDLSQWFFRQAAASLAGFRLPVEEFVRGVARERSRLEAVLGGGLRRRLEGSGAAWRRQIVAETIDSWQGGPFAAFLRGVAAVARFWPGRETASIADNGLPESEIEQSRSILVGLAARAAIGEPLVGRARLPEERAKVVAREMQSRTAGWLSAGVDALSASRRDRPSSTLLHVACEVVFGGLLLVVLFRAGWSFFHDRLWKGMPTDTGGFLWESLFWVAVCGLALRWLVVAVIGRGLDRDVSSLLARLPESRCVDPAITDFAEAAGGAAEFIAEADRLTAEASSLTMVMADKSVSLGRLKRPPSEQGEG
jgi:energy-coupling factor transporter ATP-binding protein EcfA2